MTELRGYPDTPVSGQTQDRLGMMPYARALASFIASCETPMTVAVQGGWGCGKTSLLNLVKAELPPARVETLWFNTWQYSQLNLESELSWSMLGLLLRHLGGDRATTSSLERLRVAAAGTAKVLGGLAANVALNQIGLSGGGGGGGRGREAAKGDAESVDAVAELTQLRDRLRAAVSAKLEKTGKDRLVVFVDDLDRLVPTRAVELLEVMKVFLDLPACVFVLAVDYAIVTSGVRTKYPDADEDTGKRFFDKLIQVPFVVPVGQFRNDTYLAELVQRFEPVIKGISADRSLYDDLISTSIGFNPRGLKRVFNTFVLLTSVAELNWQAEHVSDEERCVEASLLFGALCASTQFERLYHYLASHAAQIEAAWFTGSGTAADEPEWQHDLRLACDLKDPADWEAVQGFLQSLWQAAQDRDAEDEADAEDGNQAGGADDSDDVDAEADARAVERLRRSLRLASIASTHSKGEVVAIDAGGGEIDVERTRQLCEALAATGQTEFARREVQRIVLAKELPAPDWFIRTDVFRKRHGVYRLPTPEECAEKSVGYKQSGRGGSSSKGLRFHGKTLVKNLRKDLQDAYGLQVRVYQGLSADRVAGDELTIKAIRADRSVKYTGVVALHGRMKVRTAEEDLKEALGFRVEILGPDGRHGDADARLAYLRRGGPRGQAAHGTDASERGSTSWDS